jgi:hypothetical protein
LTWKFECGGEAGGETNQQEQVDVADREDAREAEIDCDDQ